MFQGALLAVLLVVLVVMHIKKKRRKRTNLAARMMAYERTLKMPPTEGSGFIQPMHPRKPGARNARGGRNSATGRDAGGVGQPLARPTRSEGAAKAAAWVSLLSSEAEQRADAWSESHAAAASPTEWPPPECEEMCSLGEGEAEALDVDPDL